MGGFNRFNMPDPDKVLSNAKDLHSLNNLSIRAWSSLPAWIRTDCMSCGQSSRAISSQSSNIASQTDRSSATAKRSAVLMLETDCDHLESQFSVSGFFVV